MSATRINTVVVLLKKEYPHAKIALKFNNNWQLLVAVILSAQCTDRQVNIVTSSLFKKYKGIKDYAGTNIKAFEKDIRSTGFYRNKAKNIIAAAKKVIGEFKAKVPNTMEELIQLPGVARKTANIVLFNGFKKSQGIAVDTHVGRLSQRLGLSKNKNPEKIEQDLIKILPEKEWGKFSYLLIEHGRAVCNAKKPQCLKCVLAKICPSKKVFYPGKK
jgi:endonuclease-3